MQKILKKHQVDPVGLFQRFGRAKYLGFGQGRAHSKPEKIFGMPYKAKEWKVQSKYQDILKYISESPDDVPTQEPAYYAEDSPMSFTFQEDFSDRFRNEFSQFFGTPVCLKAENPENHTFLQREIYGIFVREKLNAMEDRKDINLFHFGDLLEYAIPDRKQQFGIVQEFAKPGRYTNSWAFYDRIFKYNTDTVPIWKDVVAKSTLLHQVLTESTYDNQFAKAQQGARKRTRKVRFEEPAGPKKRPPTPEGPVLLPAIPSTFDNLMNILVREKKASPTSVYKSVSLVKKHLRFTPDLKGKLNLVLHSKNITSITRTLAELMMDYNVLMGPLVGAEEQIERPRDNLVATIGRPAREVLRTIHTVVCRTVMERVGTKKQKDRWRGIYIKNKYNIIRNDKNRGIPWNINIIIGI